MALIVMDCPHCTSTKTTMALKYYELWKTDSKFCNAFVNCPVCNQPIAVLLARGMRANNSRAVDLNQWAGTVNDAGYTVRNIWPVPMTPVAPEDVPKHVARNFIQAEHARQRDHREAAGMAFRRTLEIALKDIDPEGKGMLKARIDRLEKNGKLNSEMSKWAHSVRELGNEASHDELEPSKADIEDLAAFVRVTLEYLYTMPAKVARRSPKTDQREVDHPQ